MRTVRGHFRIATSLPLSATLLAVLVVTSCVIATAAPKRPAPKRPAPKRPAPKRPAPKNSGALRLKRHAFPDVTMGVSTAYTVLLPPKWSAQGKIQWQPVGEALFPQQMIEITSPQQGRISFEPMMTFSYMEAPGMGSRGVPAPANFPQWLTQAVAQSNPKLSNVKLVSSRRDAETEAFMKSFAASTGGGNMDREVWNIVLEYNEGSTRRREEASITYVRFPPYLSQNMNSQMWSIASSGAISAPASQFAAQRPLLLKVAGTLLPTPQWHTQSQAAIAAMSRQRIANKAELIRQRGRQINQMSDADYAKYKEAMSRSDDAQRQRINSIHETDDFRDTNDNIVNLPMHYKHVFSDGKGNYVLSNNSRDKPGGQWKSITPIK